MSAPLDFLRIFAGWLRSRGIRFAITSGMACVHYGLQQTTKDSDWIVASDDLTKLREMLESLECAILSKSLDRAAVKAQTTRETLRLIQPPIAELLP